MYSIKPSRIMGMLLSKFHNVATFDLFYTAKLIDSVFSGAVCVQERIDGEWENGGGDEPYYDCVRYHNGRHLPVPMVLGANRDPSGWDSITPMQDYCIYVLYRLGLMDDSIQCLRTEYGDTIDIVWMDDWGIPTTELIIQTKAETRALAWFGQL